MISENLSFDDFHPKKRLNEFKQFWSSRGQKKLFIFFYKTEHFYEYIIMCVYISLIIITAAVRFHFEDRKIMIQTLTWMENSGRQQQQTSLHNLII